MTPTEENLARIAGMRANPIYFVDETTANIGDLEKAVSGQIVRCIGNPSECVKVVNLDSEQFDAVAGWISEDI